MLGLSRYEIGLDEEELLPVWDNVLNANVYNIHPEFFKSFEDKIRIKLILE